MNPSRYLVRDIPRRRFLELGVKAGAALAATPLLLDTLLAAPSPAPPPVAVDKAVLDRVLARALARGGTFADVYLENRLSRNILLEESRFKSAEVGISQGAGVRVIVGDKTGYAYADEVT